MFHLFQAGLLQEVNAIVLGEFLAPDPSEDSLITFALNRFAREMGVRHIPVYKTNQFGHGNYNIPLLYQSPTRIFLAEGKKYPSLHIDLPISALRHLKLR